MYLSHMVVPSLFGFTLFLTFITNSSAKKGDQFGYKTIYACEGKTLSIKCDEGVIHLIRANYGRFSISICNDHGNLDWRVNCMSFHSFPIMQDRCSLKPNCSINASSTTFHDPCPGTRKYLEVQYHCASEVYVVLPPASTLSTTAKPASESNTSASIYEDKTPMFTPPSSTTNSSQKPPTILTTPKPSTTVQSSVKLPTVAVHPESETVPSKIISSKVTGNTVQSTRPPIIMVTNPPPQATILTYSKENYCPSVFARGINWTWTKSGDTAVLKCPDGASGFANWHCNANTVEWSPEKPNLQQCRSLWLENIKRQMEQGDSIISVTTELALMSSAKPLFSEDLNDISELIQQALNKGVSNMENVLDMWHRFRVLRELLQSLVQTLSNVIDDKQKAAWNDLSAIDQRSVISLLLEALEESALLLAETSSEDGSFSIVQSNVLLSLKIIKIKDSIIHFPTVEDIDSDNSDIIWTTMQDKLFIPATSLGEYSRHGLVKIVFTAYKNIDEFLRPSTYILHYPRDVSENNTRILNSRIIGASLERTGNPRLPQPVVLTLKHINEENATNPICVFWDFHSRDWSARGCWVEKTNKTHTICACDHLTNFAVIMEIKSDLISGEEMEILQIVTLTGCIVAILCLLITVVVLCSLRMIGDAVVIEKNMFFCLLIAEITFAAGIDQTKYHIVCAVIAGGLQYIFLVTFIWLFFVCYQQYIALISTDTTEKSQACFYYAAAYIIPAAIVGVSAVIDPSSYGTETYCWLHVDNYFVFSFVGPAVGILFGGLVFVCITLFIFCHRSTIATAIKGKEEAKLATVMSVSGRSLTLIIFVSLTWTSGFLYVNRRSVFLAYSFSVLNSFLGTLILAFYCLKNEKVKREYKDTFSTQHILPCLQSPQKEPESQSRERSNRTASGDNISQQFWNFQTGKSSSSMRCSSQGHLSTIPVRELDGDGISEVPKAEEKPTAKNWELPNSSQFKSDISRSGEIFMPEKSSTHRHPAGYHTLGYHQHQAKYRHFPESLEASNQFKDHIYETIDDVDEPISLRFKERSFASQQYPPAENYYGDHSDLSQHSSSSYGYDQRPLLICGAQTKFTTSLQSYGTSGDCPSAPDTPKRLQRAIQCYESEDDNRETGNPGGSTLKLPHNRSQNAQPNFTIKNCNSEVLGTLLPDLLQCPSESPAVLAVLDGDKVVSQLQQEDTHNQQPKYKLSTYC